MFAHNGAKVQSHFYPGDLVTRTGDQELRSVSGRLPDYPGELACMILALKQSAQRWDNFRVSQHCNLPFKKKFRSL